MRLHVDAEITIAKLCEEMAQCVYEELCHSNEFYKLNHDRNATVKQIAPTLRNEARTILGGMLHRNDVNEAEKDAIYLALCRDAAIQDLTRTLN